jgi:hypothetical protein
MVVEHRRAVPDHRHHRLPHLLRDQPDLAGARHHDPEREGQPPGDGAQRRVDAARDAQEGAALLEGAQVAVCAVGGDDLHPPSVFGGSGDIRERTATLRLPAP